MSTQFFSKLSQNYVELLKDDEYYDITIEVGEDPNVKIFRAHMNILCYRSPYLRRILASNKKNNDNILAHVKLQKISPEIFQIILEYIYGGILSLNVDDTNFLKILAAADNLHLQELVDYLQKYLIENNSDWIEQHFGTSRILYKFYGSITRKNIQFF
ncbi:POZ domain-containing protein [Rhizophagus irregularis]|uniref:POZ domain-containing protein n=1 Tax=Rhizophagus irregularis TaxID=588596 RepID=A0A2I1H9K9_9GLOM|nr:POZ domain-containing protein [Rhizophagus irregularis]